MVAPPPADLPRALAQLLANDVGCRFLAFASTAQLRAVAGDIVASGADAFPEGVKAAAQLLPLDCDLDTLARDHVEHLLWVAHRRAFWQTRATPPQELPGFTFATEGEHHALQTSGHPTVLITPMTLAFEDILWVTGAIARARDVVIYGEGLAGDDVFAQLDALCSLEHVRLATGPRSILEVLDGGGVFLTYPDFVYAGHAVRHASLFGLRWPFSAAFLRICARPGTMLLPAFIRRDGDDVTLHFEAPLRIDVPRGAPVDRRWAEPLVAATVARLLEAMILANPAQWQLLVTLIAESKQRAS